jgi:hypothetical protein
VAALRGACLKYRKHAVIPDTQIKPGVALNHLTGAGNYLAEKRPEVIILLGDWWDMQSLSAWDSDATKILAGVSYEEDIRAGLKGMDMFLRPIKAVKGYQPELHFCIGNHEHRITRYTQDNPMLRGVLSFDSLGLQERGFKVHPFLKQFVKDGVCYAHYHCTDSNGRVMNSKRGQASARAQVNNVGMSATAGHKQGLDVYVKESAAGRRRGLISGSFYQHDEDYLGPQGNSHWNGILLKHEIHAGDYDLLEVSLDYLLRKYT